MQTSNERVRVTQSLLSAWEYVYKLDDGYEQFLKTLNRIKEPPTKAMLDGIRFENCVEAVLNGAPIDSTHEWYKPIMELTEVLRDSQYQVSLYRDMTIAGQKTVLHGILDFLKMGTIFDTKYSKTYKVGKYLSSPQHPMYFALVPEATEFKYLICDGKDIFTERYQPDECEPIEKRIERFYKFLQTYNLWETFVEKWKML